MQFVCTGQPNADELCERQVVVGAKVAPASCLVQTRAGCGVHSITQGTALIATAHRQAPNQMPRVLSPSGPEHVHGDTRLPKDASANWVQSSEPLCSPVSYLPYARPAQLSGAAYTAAQPQYVCTDYDESLCDSPDTHQADFGWTNTSTNFAGESDYTKSRQAGTMDHASETKALGLGQVPVSPAATEESPEEMLATQVLVKNTFIHIDVERTMPMRRVHSASVLLLREGMSETVRQEIEEDAASTPKKISSMGRQTTKPTKRDEDFEFESMDDLLEDSDDELNGNLQRSFEFAATVEHGGTFSVLTKIG